MANPAAYRTARGLPPPGVLLAAPTQGIAPTSTPSALARGIEWTPRLERARVRFPVSPGLAGRSRPSRTLWWADSDTRALPRSFQRTNPPRRPRLDGAALANVSTRIFGSGPPPAKTQRLSDGRVYPAKHLPRFVPLCARPSTLPPGLLSVCRSFHLVYRQCVARLKEKVTGLEEKHSRNRLIPQRVEWGEIWNERGPRGPKPPGHLVGQQDPPDHHPDTLAGVCLFS